MERDGGDGGLAEQHREALTFSLCSLVPSSRHGSRENADILPRPEGRGGKNIASPLIPAAGFGSAAAAHRHAAPGSCC